MKFMMMMHAPRGNGDYAVMGWTPADFQAHIAFMHRLNQQLTEAGELVTAQGLAGPGQAKLVRAAADGTPTTDGVFPESKEFLAGFWIVEVEDEARAIALATQVSTAPGPGGRPLNMAVELRQVMSAPPQPE